MTIEQAIEHAEDIATSAIGCECREEHRQLADWLRELKERRKEPKIITCGECAYREIRGVDGFCDHITGEEIMVRKTDYCKWAERKTE